jgi:carbonic anhydrase/acetyltransferase-like protein (isoleucine patch superfamily)
MPPVPAAAKKGCAMPLYALDGVMPELDADCWVAPDAALIGRVRLARGASVWFGAVLRGDNDWITIGENSNVQDHSVIHADPGQPVTIGAGVTIGHRAIIHSARVDDHALVGMGAILLNGAHIGRECLVGAGALATEGKEFADGHLVLGAPARAVKPLTEDQKAGLRMSAEIYVRNSARYRDGLKA